MERFEFVCDCFACVNNLKIEDLSASNSGESQERRNPFENVTYIWQQMEECCEQGPSNNFAKYYLNNFSALIKLAFAVSWPWTMAPGAVVTHNVPEQLPTGRFIKF